MALLLISESATTTNKFYVNTQSWSLIYVIATKNLYLIGVGNFERFLY